jgi:hypothetical protein
LRYDVLNLQSAAKKPVFAAKFFVKGKNKVFFAGFAALSESFKNTCLETSMGVKVNAQTNHNHPYVNSVRIINKLSFAFVRMPWLWIKPVWYLLGYGFDYNDNLTLITDFTRQVRTKNSLKSV